MFEFALVSLDCYTKLAGRRLGWPFITVDRPDSETVAWKNGVYVLLVVLHQGGRFMRLWAVRPDV